MLEELKQRKQVAAHALQEAIENRNNPCESSGAWWMAEETARQTSAFEERYEATLSADERKAYQKEKVHKFLQGLAGS